MNDEENKMYSNLADLLNKTLENGKIPKEFVQKEESSEESNEKIQKENEKNLIENQNSQEKSFKIKIKNIKKKKTQEKRYTILHNFLYCLFNLFLEKGYAISSVVSAF